jgi:hypothetical protein
LTGLFFLAVALSDSMSLGRIPSNSRHLVGKRNRVLYQLLITQELAGGESTEAAAGMNAPAAWESESR